MADPSAEKAGRIVRTRSGMVYFTDYDLAISKLCGAVRVECSEWEEQPAWKLRGMATEARCCGQGIGTVLLRFAEAQIRWESPLALAWRRARVGAIVFCERLGWQRVSDEFEIEDVGAHVRMIKRLAE